MSKVAEKLVYGHGVNDSVSPVYWKEGGKRVVDKTYSRWKTLIARACDPKTKAKYPSYLGIGICEAWLYFSEFRAWMDEYPKDWHVLDVDKDIVSPGNLLYGPEFCRLVPPDLNRLFTGKSKTSDSLRGTHARILKSGRISYHAYCDSPDGRFWLGTHNSEKAAHSAWQHAKVDVLYEAVWRYAYSKYHLKDVTAGVMARIERLEDDIAKGSVTTWLQI